MAFLVQSAKISFWDANWSQARRRMVAWLARRGMRRISTLIYATNRLNECTHLVIENKWHNAHKMKWEGIQTSFTSRTCARIDVIRWRGCDRKPQIKSRWISRNLLRENNLQANIKREQWESGCQTNLWMKNFVDNLRHYDKKCQHMDRKGHRQNITNTQVQLIQWLIC